VRLVIVDNASPDDSIDRLKAWAAARGLGVREVAAAAAGGLAGAPLAALTVVRAPANLGYAGAVNLGLALLAPRPEIGLLWVLNPDCVVPPETPAALVRAQAAAGRFAIMGSRIVYHGTALIHADGGRVGRWSGICASVNRRAPADATPPPDPGSIDYVIGANMVVSREFLARVGPMREDYFLYYEEVDWALRRGDLPLAYLINLAQIGKSLLRDDAARIAAALRGLHGLPPPAQVARRIGPEAAALAFGPAARDAA
jgi:GT2 family glycosyltransferase